MYLLFKNVPLNDLNNAHQIARPTISEFYPHTFVILQYVANCDPQLQVTEHVCQLWNWIPNIYQCLKIEGIFYFNRC